MMLDFEVFEQIADEKQCDIAFPIKEHFLIQVIKQIIGQLHTEAGNLIFGGGTSLVCAYDELTKRFSEDADFRFVPCPKSTKSIRLEITNIIRNLDGFKLDGEPLSDSRKIEYHLIDTDNVIKNHSSLRPYIKIEVFFTDNLFYDPILLPLQSFYDKETSNKDDVKILCVALEDTSIDKISSFLWRIVSSTTEHSQYNPADMRHLNDLVYLLPKLSIDEKFAKSLLSVFSEDVKYRLKQDISLKEIVNQVIELLKTDKRFKSDYEQYVANISYAKTNDRYSFERACDVFNQYMNKIISINCGE